MKFENTEVFNFEGALCGMRNPMNSWDKLDSFFGIVDLKCPQDAREEVVDAWITQELRHRNLPVDPYGKEWEELWEQYNLWLWDTGTLKWDNDLALVAQLGPNDLSLAQKLIRAGDEHAKFMRQIFVSVDVTAPLYWWKEMDTYKVGTVANSTSTMHTLATTPITFDCFEMDDFVDYCGWYDESLDHDWGISADDCETYISEFLHFLERLRLNYLETKDQHYWKELIRWLPESWLQTRTWTANYTVLRNIYFQRRSHKLTEWHQFCDWIKSLPYGKELITLE